MAGYWVALAPRGGHFDKGIIVKETTEKNKGFHVHAHILYDGSYIPQKLLSKLWLEVTKNSQIVDIRMLRHVKGTLKYLSKYVSKGQSINSSEALFQYFIATKHIRMVQTFGKNFVITKLKYKKECPNCKSYHWMYVSNIVGLSEAINKEAIA